MSIARLMQMAASVSQGVGPDPYFNQTVLLLHGDGTNGAQNNTFLDSSPNNFTIERFANTTQGTFSPFSVGAGEWSNAFDGSGDYFTVPDNAALDLSATTWTIECWFYVPSGVTGVRALITKWVSGQRSYYLSVNATDRTVYTSLSNDGSNNIDHSSSTNAWEFDQWNHVAWTFGSSTRTIWVNGVDVGSTAYALAIHSGSSSVSVGAIAATGNMLGYISNLRVVNGREVYTSTFTPPTAPLGTTSGGEDPPQGTETALLTCQSNRFLDNSTNGFAITTFGTASIQPFSPFLPTADYNASVNGGSGYFDGVGDYLRLPIDADLQLVRTTPSTVEAWIYPITAAYTPTLWSGTNSDELGMTTTTRSRFIWSASGFNTSGDVKFLESSISVPALAWAHVACVCDGSSNYEIFVNGVSGGTASIAKDMTVRRIGAGESTTFDGYITDFRVINGTALYTTTFTPPTAPLTSITNTEALVSFTNAGIFDNTGKNNLETVANCAINTTTKKYGTGSLEFDGTADWLNVANNENILFRAGKFTIEFWVYLATGDAGSNRGLVGKGASTTGWLVSLNTTENVVFTFATSTITSSGAITLDAWNHIAVVREGTGTNETKIYINGTNDGTGTVNTNFTQTNVLYIGANRTAADPMKGFIDDLRITKGVARYTTTFTPPTAAFPDQ